MESDSFEVTEIYALRENANNVWKKIVEFTLIGVLIVSIRTLLTLKKYDIVLCNAEYGAFIRHPRKIVVFHGSYFGYMTASDNLKIARKYRYLFGDWLHRYSARNAYLTIAVSRFIKEILEKRGIEVDKIIHNSVKENKLKKLHKKDQSGVAKILYVGPSIYEKGWDRFVELIQKKHELYHYGPIISEDTRINQLGVIPHHQLIQQYHKYDIVVSPSRFEAMQVVPLEAMSAGVPVLISSVGVGCDIKKEQSVFVLDEWSTRSALHNIAEIQQNYSFYSKESIRISKNYSFSQFKNSYLQVFNEIYG